MLGHLEYNKETKDLDQEVRLFWKLAKVMTFRDTVEGIVFIVTFFSLQIFPTRYLRCPSAVTVNVLKKFLVMKFAIPETHQVKHNFACSVLMTLMGLMDRGLTDLANERPSDRPIDRLNKIANECRSIDRPTEQTKKRMKEYFYWLMSFQKIGNFFYLLDLSVCLLVCLFVYECAINRKWTVDRLL